MIRLIIIILMLALIWAEVQVFAAIGGAIGALLVILGVLATAILGIRLFRHNGKQILHRLQKTPITHRQPMLEMADGGAIVLAAGLLLIPGFITDALGFILFIPGLRVILALMLASMVMSVLPQGRVFFYKTPPPRAEHEDSEFGGNNRADAAPQVIEGEFERKD